jgi:hypothetical protein
MKSTIRKEMCTTTNLAQMVGMEMGLTTAETSSIASLNEAGSRRLPVR